jgi:Tol biopolymer transport system component
MNFWQRYRRLIIILAIIIIIAIVLLVISRPKPTETPGTIPGQTTEEGGKLPSASEGEGQIASETPIYVFPESEETINPDLPVSEIANPIASGGLTVVQQIYDANVIGASLSSDGQSLRYYDEESGFFYRLDANGNLQKLSSKKFYDVETVYWADNSNKAVLEYPDGSNILYNFTTGKQVTLPKHWESFEFSTDETQLVMKSIGSDSDNRWLIIANEDGSGAKGLEFIGTRSDYVVPSWSPNNETIAMYTKGKDADSQEVFFVGKNDENFKSIVVDGYGFQSQWSPSGDKLLYSVYSTSESVKPTLWIVDAQGDNIGSNRQNLNLETWADKCTFANDNRYVYCAVPTNLQTGAGLFPELAETSSDLIYRIDINTGVKKLIATPDTFSTVEDLMITKNQDSLYYTDNVSEGIYKIDLK